MITVLVTLGALGIATITFLRQRSLRDVLRETQRRLYLAQARLNELESTMQQELQGLRTMMRRQSGGSVFEPGMKIADAIAIEPRVRDVLAQFHLGGCSSCAINEEHTIVQAATSYGVDLERLMSALSVLSGGQDTLSMMPRPAGLLQLTQFE